MNDNSANQLLERLLQQQNQTLERLAQQQNLLMEQIQAQQPQAPKKDFWDRFNTLAPIISAAIIACTGAYFTYIYNQQQIKLQEIQTIEKFLPHLVGDEKSKRAAILAMNSLGNAKLAAKVASIFASEGTASALSSMAKNSTNEDQEVVRDALYKTLDTLAQKYRDENRYEDAVDTYKRALALKEAMHGKDSAEVTDSLNKLADLYDEHGDHAAAEDTRSRAIAAKHKPAEPQAPSIAVPPPASAANLSQVEEVHKELPAPTQAESATESQRVGMPPVHQEEHEPRAYAHNGIEQ